MRSCPQSQQGQAGLCDQEPGLQGRREGAFCSVGPVFCSCLHDLGRVCHPSKPDTHPSCCAVGQDSDFSLCCCCRATLPPPLFSPDGVTLLNVSVRGKSATFLDRASRSVLWLPQSVSHPSRSCSNWASSRKPSEHACSRPSAPPAQGLLAQLSSAIASPESHRPASDTQ